MMKLNVIKLFSLLVSLFISISDISYCLKCIKYNAYHNLHNVVEFYFKNSCQLKTEDNLGKKVN